MQTTDGQGHPRRGPRRRGRHTRSRTSPTSGTVSTRRRACPAQGCSLAHRLASGSASTLARRLSRGIMGRLGSRAHPARARPSGLRCHSPHRWPQRRPLLRRTRPHAEHSASVGELMTRRLSSGVVYQGGGTGFQPGAGEEPADEESGGKVSATVHQRPWLLKERNQHVHVCSPISTVIHYRWLSRWMSVRTSQRMKMRHTGGQPVRQVDANVVLLSPPVKLTEGCCPGLLTVATPRGELSTQGKLVNLPAPSHRRFIRRGGAGCRLYIPVAVVWTFTTTSATLRSARLMKSGFAPTERCS